VLLQHGKKLVQEGALTALASVADCSNQMFVKYYDSVMPLLLSILVGANDKVSCMHACFIRCSPLLFVVSQNRFSDNWIKALQVVLLSVCVFSAFSEGL
jgi:hypothetical protein